ncbi:MAG: hypothetical protein ABWZ76_11225 [Acidimicrobiales bacterium]
MAFGQPSGPPATGKQVQRLEELLAEAGHDGFRDARGPLGLNQRQAAGRFTRDEADVLIERLEQEAEQGDGAAVEAPSPPPAATANRQLRDVPDDVLAAELQRRGWVVMEP